MGMVLKLHTPLPYDSPTNQTNRQLPTATCDSVGSSFVRSDGDGRASCTPKHLICIDEFGKGTEDDCASAICAASLLHFDKVRR